MATVGSRGEQLVARSCASTLRPFEAAFVLQVSELDVERLVKRGALSNVSGDGWRRLDPQDVERLAKARICSGELSHLALVFLPQLVAGRVSAPHNRDRKAAPTSFVEALENRALQRPGRLGMRKVIA